MMLLLTSSTYPAGCFLNPLSGYADLLVGVLESCASLPVGLVGLNLKTKVSDVISGMLSSVSVPATRAIHKPFGSEALRT